MVRQVRTAVSASDGSATTSWTLSFTVVAMLLAPTASAGLVAGDAGVLRPESSDVAAALDLLNGALGARKGPIMPSSLADFVLPSPGPEEEAMKSWIRGVLGRSTSDAFEEAIRRIESKRDEPTARSLRLIAAGENVTVLTGPVFVDEDWLVTSPLTFRNADVVFRTANGRHAIVTDPEVALRIENSTIRQVDGRRDLYGTITARGPLALHGAEIHEIMVNAQAVPGFLGETSAVVDSWFDHALSGLTVSQNLLVKRSVFTRNYVGLRVEYKVPLSGTPEVTESTFEMNERGLQTYPQSGGTYSHLRIGANALGVECGSNGNQNLTTEDPEVLPARIRLSNIVENYGDAVTGVNGAKFEAPGTTLKIEFPDSRCTYEGNYYGGSGLAADSIFKGKSDTIEGIANTPYALPSTPAYPWPILLITAPTSWTATTPPPVLTGPVVVKNPGSLTISNRALDPRGFTIGAKVNGSIDISNVDVVGRTTLYMRNVGDAISDVELRAEVLFNGVWSHRTSSSIEDLRVLAGAPNGYGVFFWSPLYAGDSTYVRTVQNSQFRNLAGGIRTQLDKPAIQSSTFEDVVYCITSIITTNLDVDDNVMTRCATGITSFIATNMKVTNNVATGRSEDLLPNIRVPASPSLESIDKKGFLINSIDTSSTIRNNVVSDLDLGIVYAVAVGTPTLSFNNFTRVGEAVTAAFAVLASDNNQFDRGRVGFFGVGNFGVTFNRDTFTNYAIGFESRDLTGPSITSSLFAFNHIGVLITDGANADASAPFQATISKSNFIHNFGAGGVAWNVNDAEPFSVNCNQCWKEADETMLLTSATYVGAIPGPYVDVPTPYWWNSRIVETAGERALSGSLHAPAIATSGGKLTIRNTDLDLNGFAIGAKGATPGGATGRLEIVGSNIAGGSVIGMNSTDVTLHHNVFTRFDQGQALAIWENSPTIACNAFLDVPEVLTILKGRDSTPPLTFERNLVLNATTFKLGESRTLRTYEEDAVVNDNGFINLASQVERRGRGTFSATGNAFVGSGLKDYSQTNTSATAPVASLVNNYWGHPGGPKVYQQQRSQSTLVHDGPGVTLRIGTDGSTPYAAWQPYLTALPTPEPCVDFRFGPVGVTELDTLVFTSRAFDPIGQTLVQTWDFGDGTPLASTVENTMTHRFPDGGTYNVTLTVHVPGGPSASASKSVTIADVDPVADFQASIVDEITPVQFTDTSTHPNGPDAPPTGWTYAWWFGGEGTSSAQNPSFRFLDGGTKTVRLTVTDDDGRSNMKQRAITIPHVAPTASFSFDAGEETRAVVFSDTSTHPNAPRDGIVSRSWSCSDGKTSTAATFSHRFADGGTYTCSLLVSDNDGKSASVTQSIPVGHVAPNAGYAVEGATELDDFAFTDTSTHPNAADQPPSGWTWAWDFGDGTDSVSRHPAHRFGDGGTRHVALTVTDNDGETSTFSRDVSVAHVPPAADFAFPTDAEPDAPTSFSDRSIHPNVNDAIVAWAWTFGDGTTSTEQNPVHTYAQIATYVVSLTVTDDDGLSSTLAKTLRVGNEAPVADFTWTPNVPDAKRSVDFVDRSTDPDGEIVAWFWTFGDGRNATSANASISYPSKGVRLVCLTVTDDGGKSTSACKNVVIDDRLEGKIEFERPWRTDREIYAEFTLKWDDGRPVANAFVRYEKWYKQDYVPPQDPPPVETCTDDDCPQVKMGDAPYYRKIEGYTDSEGRVNIGYWDNEPTLGSWRVQPSNVPGTHEFQVTTHTTAGYLGNLETFYMKGAYFVEEDKLVTIESQG